MGNAAILRTLEEPDDNFDSMACANSRAIHRVILDIGIPPSLLGYMYIITSIERILSCPEYLNHVTKGLYIDVAKSFSTTPSRVERDIRHAIAVGWSNCNLEVITETFGKSVDPLKSAPSNSRFLAGIYYYLRNTY